MEISLSKSKFSPILKPLAWLWENVYRVRRYFYRYGIFRQRDFNVPIISVGNLSFGGTGKTPFTIWLSKYCNQLDKKVMILTRGYKGKLEHSHGIMKTGRKLGFNPFEYGDEALLLIRHIKDASVVVGKRRADNLQFYFEDQQPDIVILDDGHQHLNLGRNCNIVLFDALMPMTGYQVAPLGYLREGMRALKDADLVIISRSDQVSPEKLVSLKELINKNRLKSTPIAEVYYKPLGLFNLNYELEYDLDFLKDKDVICLAAIASPDYFFQILESHGANIIEKLVFPDHHFFSVSDIEEAVKKAEENDVYLITTEKDFVKLRRLVENRKMLYLGVEVDFKSGRETTEEIIRSVLDNN